MQLSTNRDELRGGFANPSVEAANAFRQIMQAMARPGTLVSVSGTEPPAPLSVAAGVIVLTLCDADTPVCLLGDTDCYEVRQWIAFHTGAPLTDAAHCRFALGAWKSLLPLSQYPLGSAAYPDRSATLIAEVPMLVNDGVCLQGPGIRDTAALSLPETEAFAANHAQYPLGLDFFFTHDVELAALPRSTRVSVDQEAG